MKKNKIVKISLRASKNISKRHLSNLTKVPKKWISTNLPE